jgi:hypothetical protein
MDFNKKIEGTRQIGAEFMTWLMFRSLSNQGILATPQGNVEVWFESSVTFVSPYAGGEVNILKGESPAEGKEAFVSLRKGKQVEQARLSVTFQAKRFELAFNGPAFAVSAAKVPAVLGEDDEQNVLERFELLASLEDIIRTLYHDFLVIRCDERKWTDECKRFDKWLTKQQEEQE